MSRKRVALKGKKSQPRNADSSMTRPTHSSSLPSRKNSSRRRLYVGIAIGALVLLFAAFLLGFNLFVRQDIRIPEVTQKMTSYLERKYNQSFEVTNVRHTGFGFGVTGVWRAEAHPRSDAHLIFTVDSDNRVARIYDGYQTAIWSAHETKALGIEAGRIYESSTTRPKVSVRISSSGELADTLVSEQLTFEQARARYVDGLLYELQVESSVKNESAIDADADRVFRLIEYAKSNKAELVSLHYTLTFSNEKYICTIKSSRMMTLKSSQDIKNCLSGKDKGE